MNKLLVLILVLLSCIIADAQSSDNVSIRAEKLPMLDFIKEIESGTSFKFYFLNRWIDSLRVSGNYENQPVKEVLQSVFSKTKIHFFIEGYKIVLTNNTPIVEKLDPSYFSSAIALGDDSFTFRREIVAEVTEKTESRNEIIEIGRVQQKPPNRVTLSGYVKDKKSNEAISAASVYFGKLSVGTTTNASGFYSISIPPGAYFIDVKYVGMTSEKKQVILNADGKLNFLLEEDVISLKEVVVKADADVNISSLQMGKTTLDIKSIKNVPKVLGENDILRVAMMLPGVKSVGEGSSGLNVRGGNADQNLMLLNEATTIMPLIF
jgi:hypothetical protein